MNNYGLYNETKKHKCLPDNRFEALQDLHINPTHKHKVDESPIFLLYLNYAIKNICDIAGLQYNVSSNGVVNALEQREKEQRAKKTEISVYREIADFLWLFAVENPNQDYKDYKKYTISIVHKLFLLRDYFAHLNKDGVDALVVDQEFYHFVGGVLRDEAISNSNFSGLRTGKIYKMKLFARRDEEKKTYEFTRRGLIFLICLALYKDDAHDFTRSLDDMKSPENPNGEDNLDKSKPKDAKAFIKLFTYFSIRHGRSNHSVNLREDDLNYLSFANIIGYLNKTPADAMTYLTLNKENSFLKGKCDASQESEDNKNSKYILQKRFQNKFLSLSTGYIEDFGKLESLRFKRLDISNTEGRKKYFFGKEHDNRVHMNRHYEISQGCIHFEWRPQKHYGSIHIDSLRSSISAKTMKELLYCIFNGGVGVNREIDEFFKSYHRFLEKILNTQDIETLSLEGSLLDDACIITNCASNDEMKDNYEVLLSKYFSDNLIRFFNKKDLKQTDEELNSALVRKLGNLSIQADDFLTRLRKLNAWREELSKSRKKDSTIKLPKPKCDNTEVSNPPRSCDMSDAALIHWVFRYFNLYLKDEEKFRQLPRGKQHRGDKDFEYQTVHALIGKYALDSNGLNNYLIKKKVVLIDPLQKLESKFKEYKNQLWRKKGCPRTKNGIPKKTSSLAMLAEAAAVLYKDYIEEEKANIAQNIHNRSEIIKSCRKFGVRLSLPISREALIKTILHIDLAKWTSAYDYESDSKYESRTLSDTGHILSQIPLPVDFAQRVIMRSQKPDIKEFFIQKGENTFFDFNAAFLKYDEGIKLRDFYDIKPLIDANYRVKPFSKQKNTKTDSLKDSIALVGEGGNTNEALKELLQGVDGLRTPSEEEFDIDFSRAAIRAAIENIKEANNQDKLLSKMALEYWSRFEGNSTFTLCRSKKETKQEAYENRSVYDFLDEAVEIDFPQDANRKIKIMPNDVNRPILSQIYDEANKIAREIDKKGEQRVFDFNEMLKKYREIQYHDRDIRLQMIPLISVFDYSVNVPDNNSNESDRDWHFRYYKEHFDKLTREEFDEIVDFRDKVYHRGLNLNKGNVETILRKYISLPEEKIAQKKESCQKKYGNWNKNKSNHKPSLKKTKKQ